MSTPIGDAVTQAVSDNSAGIGSVQPTAEDVPAQTDTATPSPDLAPLPPADNSVPGKTGVGALLEAQNAFIMAQMTFIHNKDLGNFATAQEQFILAQGKFISGLGTR